MDFVDGSRYKPGRCSIFGGGLMTTLIIAAMFFVGIHLFIAGTGLRARLVRWAGEEMFQALFSLLSLGGIIWLSRAYGQAEYVELWGQVQSFRMLALIFMLIAFFFVVFAFTAPNPTAVRGGSLLKEKEPARGIQRITRHPFLCGVALWSFTHLAFNGDLASLVFFGAFLILSLAGPASIDKKRKEVFGADWDRFAAVTSIIPFMAIIQERNSLQLGELGWWRPVVAVIVFGIFLDIHRYLFGVSPWPV
jgi:uncharacterized membrane protein